MTPLPTDFERLKKLALEQDWIVRKTNGGHWKFLPPKGKAIVIASHSPGSDSHIQPLRAELRRAGLLGITPEIENPPVQSDTIEYFSMPPKEVTPVKEKRKYGALKEVILEALRKQNGRWAFPEDIFPRIQASFPTLDMNKLKVAMNGYAQTRTLEKSEDGKYTIPEEHPLEVSSPVPAKQTRITSIEPANEEDLKALENLLQAMAAAERVIKKHIDLERQLGQLKTLLGANP